MEKEKKVNKEKKVKQVSKGSTKKTQAGKKTGHKTGETSHMGAMIGAGVLVVCLIIFTIVTCMEQLSRKAAILVNDSTVYYDDAMYDLYALESEYSSMNQLYMQFYGHNYWDETDDDGVLFRDKLKEELLARIVQTEIMYDQAKKAGYTLTDEDKTKAAENTNTAWKQLSMGQKKDMKASKSQMKKYNERQQMAQRYKQSLIDGYDINDEEIKAGISFDEFKQYDVEYYFASFKTTDEEGNEKDMEEASKKSLLEEMNAISEKAKTAETFSGLTEIKEDGTGITYQEVGFITGDNTFEEKIETQVKAMANNAVSGVIEGEKGCYIVKMINNNSTETYDAKVKDAITQKENEAFLAEYEPLSQGYKVDLKPIWDTIVIGSITS